ncbi:SMI1/KNR4 family protein [Aestuariivirga sp. YIM B02566]|uniref:SMI1/KNR4 family protein n=1 Tax=Taklimakanibacter albus TaxID=2800327 RepID=A0ACC5R930_9HYPH|nr:SMI1/KNR4 family protein [Aestuariivirga sp. YIM B02566]MBK1869186.1 SMI1/KNR4 family protein [Aestuariivirga sp. YIM B02566]
MAIELRRGGRASDDEIARLEEALGEKLPDVVRDFFRHHDGAKPENNTFAIGKCNESSINQFIPVREIEKEREQFESISSGAFPIAFDECGNYVLVDLRAGGAVYFWDHELDETVILSKDFASFLALLQPFDINSVELKPGQVKRVWIAPGFLESLKEKK